MTTQRTFVRKISYFLAIGVLLLPLFLLGMPSTNRGQGGKLAQVRTKNRLHQADLGQIDPTSATMKLMTFGFNGLAVNRLWETHIDAKEREDWTTCGAALEQIKNLQPHSVEVWRFQAHNVSFNISCEFDDFRDRYRYIMKGIDMLTEGIRYNERSPHLLREEARFIGFKIGKSDEAELFRPMFIHDDEYHQKDNMKGTRYAGRPETMRDNWQVSKWWYERADKLFDEGLASYGGLNSAVVHSDAAHSQMQYAKSLELDGHFGDKALREWSISAEDWRKLGAKLLQTGAGLHIRLASFHQQREEEEQLRKDFDKLVAEQPGLQENILAKRRAALSEVERTALDTKDDQRSGHQKALAAQAAESMRISRRDLALEMKPEHQTAALKLADRLTVAEDRLRMTDKYRDVVNYEYWRVRCEVERRADTLEAREQIYAGDQALAKSKLPEALEHYNRALAKWKVVIDTYPRLLAEKTMVMELMQIVDKYQKILKQNGAEMPKPFVLQPVLDAYEVYTRQEKAQGE